MVVVVVVVVVVMVVVVVVVVVLLLLYYMCLSFSHEPPCIALCHWTRHRGMYWESAGQFTKLPVPVGSAAPSQNHVT